MANKSNDDVAKALAALAGGAVPSEHETPSGGIPSESTVFSPEPPPPPAAEPPRTPKPPPSRPRPPVPQNIATKAVAHAPRAVAPPAAAPARQAVPAPAQPSAAANSPGATVLPAKIRAPSKRPATPTRPAAPINTPPPEEPEPEDDDGSILDEITEDDDVIAPAPDISAFMHRPRPAAPSKPAVYERLQFRRTLIPILLTGGVMLIGLGIWSRMDPAGPLAAIGLGITVMLMCVGGVLLGLGVLNMLHVKHLLDTTATPEAGK